MKRFRQLVAALTLLAVFFCALPITGEAAKNSYVKKTGVKWGIKAGKSYTFPAYYSGIKSTKPVEWTISKPKVSKADKHGFKRMIFTMSMVNLSDFTQKEVDIICSQESFGGGVAWFLVDENDGKSLEATKNTKKKKNVPTNKHGVYSSVKILEERAIDGYVNTKGNITFYPQRRFKARVTLMYPADYDGMCIGIGTYKDMTSFSSSDAKFFRGKIPVGKSSMFKKSKKCLRFMNLSDM